MCFCWWNEALPASLQFGSKWREDKNHMPLVLWAQSSRNEARRCCVHNNTTLKLAESSGWEATEFCKDVAEFKDSVGCQFLCHVSFPPSAWPERKVKQRHAQNSTRPTSEYNCIQVWRAGLQPQRCHRPAVWCWGHTYGSLLCP